MTTSPDQRIGIMDGAAALPRKNGELVFAAPWEGRVFGMAVALHDRDLYAWDDFRDQLIAEITAAEARGEAAGYYERWLASFETLLVGRGVITRAELDARTAEYASGERDDDHHHHHHHDHDHDHGH
jgi:nitrile hydratase accessory protein